MTRRTIAHVAFCAAAAPLLAATSASGHAGNPNMESIVRSVTPAMPGFTVEVLNGDDRLELVNASRQTVTIYGYNKEPYLRMGADGAVSVNLRSPAHYLNQERFTGAKVPASATAKAAPRWQGVERGGRYQFHDHRMHWMAKSVPPQVKDRSQRTKIFDWSVPLRAGQTGGSIKGQLFWRGSGGDTPIGAFVGMGVLMALSAASVVVVRRRRGAAAGSHGAGAASPKRAKREREEAW